MRYFILTTLLFSASSLLAQLPALRDIRYGTHDEYTRIVFEFSDRVQPVVNENSSERNIELIFRAVEVSSTVKALVIDDGVVKQVSIKKIADGIIVSVSIMAPKFTLRKHYFEQPDRVVIDVYKSDERQLTQAEQFLQEGIDFFQRKEYDEALSKFRDALRIRSGYTDAYYYAGIIRKDRNQFDMAKFNFGRALTDEEKWGESHLFLAEILLVETDTASAIKELSRYVAVGKSEEKVIQAEALLSTISGLPSIESPAEKPSEIEDDVLNRNRKMQYSVIGAVLLIIIALSIYVFRDKENSSTDQADKDEDLEEIVTPIEPDDEKENDGSVSEVDEIKDHDDTPVEPEIKNGSSERWLSTDKQAIAEVDRLMDKFGELEENEKQIDKKISKVTDRISGKSK